MAPGDVTAPRVLIRRLRQIMARAPGGKARLDEIVRQVAALLVAEVCSIYVRRADGSLELFATEGLNPDAVHNTHLRPGEGLVGLIADSAEPISLAEAQADPAFSYRSETGEEKYHSFLGVPILRAGRVLGVLTLQNVRPRNYSEDELEAMETTAMVLAELIASGEVEGLGDAASPTMRAHAQRIAGHILSEGVALGHVVLHEPRILVSHSIAEDVSVEVARIEAALWHLTETVDTMLERGDMARAGEHRDVLEAFRMLAHDRGWKERLGEAVTTGLTAEAAVERVRNDMRVRMARHRDPFWRERLHDLDDLSARLLRILAGREATAAGEDLPRDAILIARNLGPAELLDYDRSRLRGLVLEEGGPASHVAIVARALDIATIGHASGIVDMVDPGDAVVVDALGGEVHIRPNPEIIDVYSDKVRFLARRQKTYAALRDRPAITRDGVPIGLHMNAGLLVELPHLAESGAEGIGLFRTELQFLISATFPRRERQTRFYEAIFEAAGGRPVVFRTLDIGGDKTLPFMRHVHEENPALGWRAMRIALDRPGLLRTQVRALLRAGRGRVLRIMLPMISEVAELDAAMALVAHERALLARQGREGPKDVALGVMIEVPALLWRLDELLPKIDFASIGSNDLLQFLFAADRANERVATRYDPLSPAVLRVLRMIVEAAGRHGTPLTLCGEMASRPLEAMALIGLGFRTISMVPAAIGAVKTMILSLDAGALARLMEDLVREEAPSVRGALERFAAENDIVL